jgi:hypothetical protein
VGGAKKQGGKNYMKFRPYQPPTFWLALVLKEVNLKRVTSKEGQFIFWNEWFRLVGGGSYI